MIINNGGEQSLKITPDTVCGYSNGGMVDSWPKVSRGKKIFSDLVNEEIKNLNYNKNATDK